MEKRDHKRASKEISNSCANLQCSQATQLQTFRVSALFMRFSLCWGAKWNDHVHASGTIPLIAEWSQGIEGLTDADLSRGLATCRDTLDWPPTIAQMRKASEPPQPPRRLLRDTL